MELPRSQQGLQGGSRQEEIERQKEIEKEKQLERLALLEKQKQEMELEEQRLREIERQKQLEKQREEERRREEERVKQEKAEEERRRKENEEKRKAEAEAEQERLSVKEEQGKVEVTTFGPFSPFKNFPSFPVNVLENQQEQLELRGPNLLPTRPTTPPSPPPPPPPPPPPTPPSPSPPRPSPSEEPGQPRGPPGPVSSRPDPGPEDELRFIPSPPLRDPVPPVNVFLSQEEEQDSPSVFLQPQQPNRPTQNFQNTFFKAQTQLGQTQTRIPPQQQQQQQQPFTFFGGQFQSGQARPTGGPVSFPGQQSFSPRPPSTNQQFVSFNNFRSEQPRTLQSVFGSSLSPSLPPNTFFSRDARFERRPTPSSVPAGRPRESPPQTFSTNQRQSSSANFPPPQFGGFRPIKRNLHVSQVTAERDHLPPSQGGAFEISFSSIFMGISDLERTTPLRAGHFRQNKMIINIQHICFRMKMRFLLKICS